MQLNCSFLQKVSEAYGPTGGALSLKEESFKEGSNPLLPDTLHAAAKNLVVEPFADRLGHRTALPMVMKVCDVSHPLQPTARLTGHSHHVTIEGAGLKISALTPNRRQNGGSRRAGRAQAAR